MAQEEGTSFGPGSELRSIYGAEFAVIVQMVIQVLPTHPLHPYVLSHARQVLTLHGSGKTQHSSQVILRELPLKALAGGRYWRANRPCPRHSARDNGTSDASLPHLREEDTMSTRGKSEATNKPSTSS
ncbi:uncharacterized protein SPSK_10917 [Sporothrix schenckii 1099-18]|uniref:Uncharacterized protein n=1 Tax=Sporothrix schenckii 1099-18 TaxID=1397361 RepID=A0A0F2M7B5_SPOSC|nr:uncharacterized protein SPSK_10917 [Sporothrix schenckii 1099-18]KJR85527.1 hypothetical protein SPSK_10917 [Sporothrix schenckii 1099-18]